MGSEKARPRDPPAPPHWPRHWTFATANTTTTVMGDSTHTDGRFRTAKRAPLCMHTTRARNLTRRKRPTRPCNNNRARYLSLHSPPLPFRPTTHAVNATHGADRPSTSYVSARDQRSQ